MKLIILVIFLLLTIKSTSCSNLHDVNNNDKQSPTPTTTTFELKDVSYFPFGESVRFDILNKDDTTGGGKGFQGKVGIDVIEPKIETTVKNNNPSLLNEYLEIDFKKSLVDNRLDHHHYQSTADEKHQHTIPSSSSSSNVVGNGGGAAAGADIDPFFLNKPSGGGHGYIPNKNNNNKRDEL